MTKTETNLIEAINSGDYQLSIELFEQFQSLKSTTDEEASAYFCKIEAIGKPEIEQKIEEVEVYDEIKESIELDEEEEVKPIKIEKRGRKAKDVDRKELEDGLDELINKALAFNEKVSRSNAGDVRFARRISRELINLRKRLVR